MRSSDPMNIFMLKECNDTSFVKTPRTLSFIYRGDLFFEGFRYTIFLHGNARYLLVKVFSLSYKDRVRIKTREG